MKWVINWAWRATEADQIKSLPITITAKAMLGRTVILVFRQDKPVTILWQTVKGAVV